MLSDSLLTQEKFESVLLEGGKLSNNKIHLSRFKYLHIEKKGDHNFVVSKINSFFNSTSAIVLYNFDSDGVFLESSLKKNWLLIIIIRVILPLVIFFIVVFNSEKNIVEIIDNSSFALFWITLFAYIIQLIYIFVVDESTRNEVDIMVLTHNP